MIERDVPAASVPQQWSGIFDARRLTEALKAAGPPLLFGLRLWASVCLALYIAFWLDLDNAYWAGTSAAIVGQPHLGASLRKGWYRLIGIVIGAVAIVVLTVCFPQDRAPFLVGLALWGAGCALVAPKAVAQWSLTSLREKLIKIGAKVVSHGRYVTFQLAEVAVPRQMFQQILSLTARKRAPTPA
jgi:hypothetical protein